MAKPKVCAFVLAAAVLVPAAGHAQDDALRLTQGAVPPGTEGPFHLPPALGIGTEVAPEVYAAWDIDVSPDGAGLPEGRGTLTDGEEVFNEYCAVCHNLADGEPTGYPMLAGGFGTLRTTNPKHTLPAPERRVGDYWPYASTIFDYVRRAMPFQAPKSLTDDEVYALTAFILRANDIGGFGEALDHDSFLAVEMPNRDGFIPLDPRPDTRNVACMADCPPIAE